MKKIILVAISFFFIHTSFCQLKFDLSKVKRKDTTRIFKTHDSTIVYFDMKYGEHDFLNNIDAASLENRIVKKIQYVYTDYPKDFDYSDLIFQRFASLYVQLPNFFNKPWIEWEIIKQTKCNSAYEASKMFHGFIITFKGGSAPNAIVAIPKDIQQKLDKLDCSVKMSDIKSSDDIKNFLSSKEIKISDVKYPNNSAVKLFNQNNPGSFPIIKGLFLTTGLPTGAIGPNNSPSVTAVNRVAITPDKQLHKLAGNKSALFDLSVVEFDILVDADSLVFQYAFASEEYPEFLQFNDVFGLFITGSGLNDFKKDSTINLATLPDGKTPISVSAINHLENSEYYIPNSYTTDLKLFKTWQYDGFTKVFTARIKVKPKQKYHVKFAIADYGDPYYDSAIFIDAFGVRAK